MTCPHCQRRLRRRERSGNRCSLCGRGFVFEPHDHGSRLTDVRVLRAATWLADGARYRFTLGQLAVAVGRRGGVPPNFADTMRQRWPQIHGSLPLDLVDRYDARTAPKPTAPPTAHVLCPDSDVRTCLLANDAQRVFQVLVTDDLPPGPEPVLVFDDGTEHARELRRSGRRAIAVTPPSGRTRLVEVRPSVLFEWLDLSVRAETRFRDGARRAAGVDFLNWPR
jgi:hypothetical protein